MSRLENLASAQKDCDVVALTGDCVSSSLRHVPKSWNVWPQPLLLAVPGNHDKPDTYKELGNWQVDPPYARRFNELIFMGLSSPSKDEMADAIKASGCRKWKGCRGVAVLSHYCPKPAEVADLATTVRDILDLSTILFLHGHEHPSDFSGSKWSESAADSTKIYFSHVYSGARGRRGLGHRIEWDGSVFRFTPVQGQP